MHGHSLFRSLVDILIQLLQALHTEVLDPLFVLLAIALELPEDYFTKIHQYSEKSEVRMIYSSPILLMFKPMHFEGPSQIHEIFQVFFGGEQVVR